MPVPILVPLAISAAGALAKAAPAILPSKEEKANREALRKLENSALGLTDQEKSVLEGRYASGIQASQEAARSHARALLSGAPGLPTGAALAASTLAREQALPVIQQAVSDVNLADLQRKQEQRMEIEARRQENETRKIARVQAVGGLVQTAGSLGIDKLNADKLSGTAKAPIGEQTPAVTGPGVDTGEVQLQEKPIIGRGSKVQTPASGTGSAPAPAESESASADPGPAVGRTAAGYASALAASVPPAVGRTAGEYYAAALPTSAPAAPAAGFFPDKAPAPAPAPVMPAPAPVVQTPAPVVQSTAPAPAPAPKPAPQPVAEVPVKGWTVTRVREMIAGGASEDAVFDGMVNAGLTDEEINAILDAAGY